MCRGLAVGYSHKKGVICKGLNSHAATLDEMEDECLKLEVIIDLNKELGYDVELDENMTGKMHEQYKNYIVKGKLCQEVKDIVLKDLTSRKEFFKWMIQCKSYANYGSIGNNNSHQETKGNTYNNSQKTQGYTDNSGQKTKGDTHNSFQVTKGNAYNSDQETEGNTYNSRQKTDGYMYISYIQVGTKKRGYKRINEFINKLSKENEDKLEWKTLVDLAIKGYNLK